MELARVAVLAVAALILVAPLCGALTAFGKPKPDCRQENKFDCKNGKCISGSQWCDGNDDCGNNEDEMSCRVCLSGSLKCKASKQCVPSGARCNGVVECQDETDEIDCEDRATEVSMKTSGQTEEAKIKQEANGAPSNVVSMFLLTVPVIALIRR